MGFGKSRPPGKHRKRGKHADAAMCSFTWSTTYRDAGNNKCTRRHACGQAITNKSTRRCDGDHVCRDWDCPDPVYED